MRTLLSAFCALLSLGLTAGALAAAWTESRLVDARGFVELAGPLGHDAKFQKALTSTLAREVTDGTGLPDQLKSFIRPAIADAATSVTGNSGYPQAWEETLRISHRLTFAAAPAAGEPAPTVLTLDVGPLARLLADQLGSRVGLKIPVPGNTTVEVGTLENGGMFSFVGRFAGLWPVLAGGAGLSGALALLFARRRSTTLALLGLGGAGIGAAGLLGAGMIPDAAVAAAGPSPIAQVFVRGLAGRVAGDLAESTAPVIAGGLVVLLVGVALRLTFGRRGMP